MRLILLPLLFISLFSLSQDVISEKDFENRLTEDIVVIEFYAEWNKDNSLDHNKFKDVASYIVNIEECPSLTKEYKVLSVPTLIIFYNKDVVEKYEADLTFQLCTKSAEKKVEELVLKKFM